MVQVCADRLAAAGLKTMLYTQALHELDLPRRYQTIIAVGVFGLGTTREQDVEALRRLRAHLVPGGTLAVDIELPWTNGWVWGEWARRPDRPQRWRPPIERALPDGSVIQIRGRVLSFDPLDQSRRQLIRVRLMREGRVEREERRKLVTRWYLPAELRLLLERSGFRDVRISAMTPTSRRMPHPKSSCSRVLLERRWAGGPASIRAMKAPRGTGSRGRRQTLGRRRPRRSVACQATPGLTH